MLPFSSSLTWANQEEQPFLSNFLATKTEITQLGITFLSPLKGRAGSPTRRVDSKRRMVVSKLDSVAS